MSEGVFSFFRDLSGLMILFALVTGVWTLLIIGILVMLRECLGIDLLSRWRKRK